MTVSVLLLFVKEPWVDLQCVIVVISDHALLFFSISHMSMLVKRDLRHFQKYKE